MKRAPTAMRAVDLQQQNCRQRAGEHADGEAGHADARRQQQRHPE